MKKYLSLIAVLALLVACMIPVSAAETATAIIESKSVEMGEGTVEVTLTVSTGDSTYASGQLNGLTVSEGATIKNVTGNGLIVYNPDEAVVAFVNATNVTGTFLNIVVEVPVSKPGAYTVSFSSGEAADAVKGDYALAVTAGTITVKHDCVAGEWEVVKEATCTEDGLRVQKCTLCGEVMNEEVIKALGHAWDEGVLPEIYDCDDVLKTYTCKNDPSHTKTEDASHDHVMAKYPISERYTEDGSYYVTYQDKCTHAADHGCTEVGETYEELVTGPITGDITPYIAMGVLTMVALVSAAAYMLLKRKAI